MYPEWKLLLWRFIRVFFAAFLAQLALLLPNIEEFSVELLWPMLILPAVTAGVVALSKALRDRFGDDEYTDLVHKLPL